MNLEKLDLSDNKISDIGPLSGLINLITLFAENNEISDWSPLEHLSDIIRTPSTPPVELGQPGVERVAITYAGGEVTDFHIVIGENVPLSAKIEPMGVDAVVEWISSDTDVFTVASRDYYGTSATVTGVGIGVATLTVRAGDVEATAIVRCSGGGGLI